MAEAFLTMNTEKSLDLATVRVVEQSVEELKARNIVGFDHRDKRSRPFNLMRTQLLKRLPEGQVSLVGVTSAGPAAGKSFLSVNLAASISQVSTDPTYLVDLDLRRGCVAKELGLNIEPGVTEYLSGEVEHISEIAFKVANTGLVVLPTGSTQRDSAQAIAGSRFDLLIRSLRQQGRGGVVIFDLPPVFANDDAALTASRLDGYILVVDCGNTSRRQIVDAMEMLKPAPCLGTILNRYSGGVLDAYGYGSAEYDKYYAE